MELKFSNGNKKHFEVLNNLSHSSEKCALISLHSKWLPSREEKKILDAGLV